MGTATDVLNHIRLDEKGVAWIDHTRVKVIEVAMDWLAHRSTPEEMHFQYPHLSVAQIQAALAFYHDHKPEFDQTMAGSLARAEKLAVENTNSPVQCKLRALGSMP